MAGQKDPPSFRILALLLAVASADMLDTLYPEYVPAASCADGCLPWARVSTNETLQRTINAMWGAGAAPAGAGANCAIPAAAVNSARSATGEWTGDCPLSAGWNGNLLCNASTSSFYGPICACATPTGFGFVTCTAPTSVAEQINLQIASSDTVVVSFVTFEQGADALLTPPQAQLRLAGEAEWQLLRGISHRFESSHDASDVTCFGKAGRGTLPSGGANCAPRNYNMAFVRFAGLAARQLYEYRVRGGVAANGDGGWSDIFNFRALYGGVGQEQAGLETRVAIYGDMGNTHHNNMGNLFRDCAGRVIDAIVHLGDHCYNIGFGNDLHGDAYMNAFQPTIASCPWLPVIGNHESTSGGGGDRVDAATEEHYLNQTWGVAWGDDAAQLVGSTANTSLGHLLTRGSFLAAGSHGSARSSASRTSRWSSVDIGLIHFAVLDLDPGPPAAFDGEQVEWLEEDLAAAVANRDAVPWIVVGSHFPLYSAAFAVGADTSLAWYVGDTAERERGGESWERTASFQRCSESDEGACPTVADAVAVATERLEPLLARFGVDVYCAGHVHSYSVSWPILNGSVTQRHYDDPTGTVHLLEGNGGVPGQVDSGNAVYECAGLPANSSNYRICGRGGSYGRLIAFNASVLQYEHVENPTSRVSDTWAIRKSAPNKSAR